MLQQGDVVCDRFVASTASFKLANRNCPWQEFQESLNNWKWPSTCRQPDIIIHLLLQEDERTRRILSRGEPLDQQEARLLEDPSFRIRTLAVFNELCDVTIDITGLSTDQIVKKIRFEIGNDGAVVRLFFFTRNPEGQSIVVGHKTPLFEVCKYSHARSLCQTRTCQERLRVSLLASRNLE